MPDDLDPFKRTLCYRREAPIGTILAELDAIRKLDRASERRQWAWTVVGVLGAIGAFGLLFVAPSVPVLFLGSGILAVVGFVMRARSRRTNLDNRRYDLLARVLELLARDAPADAGVRVELDLRRPDVKEKFLRAGKVGPWDVKFYTDPWLDLRGRLLDGSAYRLSLIDRHQARSRKSRSRSGKTKHKSKSKCATEATLAVKAKPRRYPGLATVAGTAREAVKLPDWATLKGFGIEGGAGGPPPDGAEPSAAHRLTLRAATKAPWDVPPASAAEAPGSGVRLVAMMFLSLYQVLHLARAVEGD